MKTQQEKAREFEALHVKGDPVIIYNAWDGGSAKAIAASGAKAIASGDHPVGFAHGFGNDDFADFTFDIYLPTIREIGARVSDLPFSVDINNADGLTGESLKERIRTVIDAGAVGVNYEDALNGGGVLDMDEQAARIRDVRTAANDADISLFINARTDIFAQPGADAAALLDEAVARAEKYAEAGANGFFVPGLMDIELIRQVCERVALPVNIIRLPGAPNTADLKDAGVARVSYGPVPQMAMIEWLKEQAGKAIRGEE